MGNVIRHTKRIVSNAGGSGSSSSGVPYTGATGDVDLGIYKISASAFNHATLLQLQVGGVNVLSSTATALTFSPALTTSGVVAPFTYTLPNSTGQTASTESIGMNFVSGTVTHATGALTLQRDYYFRSRTHAFAGASTVTNITTVQIDGPTLGALATFTNSFALIANGGVKITDGAGCAAFIGAQPGFGAFPAAIYLGDPAMVRSGTNYNFWADGSNTYINAPSGAAKIFFRSTNNGMAAFWPGAGLKLGAETAPAGWLDIIAGTTATPPLMFNSGTNTTTAVAGAMEYNGTNLFFTRTGTTRQTVLTGNVVTTEVVVSDTTITVNIAGTNYKLLARA